MTKPAFFRDETVQAKFDRNGYVVIDFISAEAAGVIARKFYELHQQIPGGFYSAAFNPDDNFRKEIFDHTEKIFQRALEENFQHIKKLGATFLCKAKGEAGKVNVHQDWMVVDEKKFSSATVWVPVLDTNEENGTLRVLPGSHLFFDEFRSNNIPVCYDQHKELIWENMITVPVKAGQAFVLNHAVIHGSSANQTNQERLVIAYGVTSENAPLLFYYQNADAKNNRVEKFEMPDDFFLQYHNAPHRPLFGRMTEEFNYPVNSISRKKMELLIKKSKSISQTQNKSFLRRIFNLSLHTTV